MVKKPVSWIELVKIKSDELKKAGDAGGLKKAIKESKAVWEDIKAGKHDLYVQGKSSTRKGKKEKKEKKGKTEKNTKNSKKEKHSKLDVDAEAILKICNSSSSSSLKIKKIKKMLGKKTRKVHEVPEMITTMGGEPEDPKKDDEMSAK